MAEMHPHYLIIGNGAAGLSAAEAIRKRDEQGRITILTNEPYRFYSRPGIAYYLLDQLSDTQLIARSADFYQQHRFELRHAHAAHLDTHRQMAQLASGERLKYDVALLATGASAVPPPFPGGDLEGIVTLDSLDDAKKVAKLGRRAKASVVVGGGITAMELAEGLHYQGRKTHFLQRRGRVWPRLFDEHESAIIESQIRHEGIQLHFHEEVEEVLGKRGKVAGVRLKSGKVLKCQVVGVAIGVRPNLALVKDELLEQERGVLVNQFMQSSVGSLFAAGDVAQVYDRWTEQYHLDVLWPSAINEGRAAGYNMVDVAQGRQPSFSYTKGSPFNSALLFGVHMTVTGRVGAGAVRGEAGSAVELSHLSRGASHVWMTPFTSSYRSAWDRRGTNSLRLVIAEGRIVGALLMGNQALADRLRWLIEQEVDVTAHVGELTADGADLASVIEKLAQ